MQWTETTYSDARYGIRFVPVNLCSIRTIVIIGAFCAGLLTGLPAGGAEFSWQLSAAHGQDDADGVVDSARWTLTGTYYPTAVDDDDGPYMLAPYLQRSSFVTVDLSRADEERVLIGYHAGPPEFIDRLFELYARSTTESVGSSVSGRYVWAGSGWYVGGGGEREGTDERPSMRDTESSAYRVEAGKYLGGSTTVDMTLGKRRERQEPDEVVCEPFRLCDGLVGTDTDTEEAALSVRHVGTLWGDAYSLSAQVRSSRSEVGLVRARLLGLETTPGAVARIPHAVAGDPAYTEKQRTYFVSGEWFPMATVGVKLGYSRVKQEMLPGTEGVGLSGSWFFRKNVAVQVTFTRTRLDVPSDFEFRYSDTASVRLVGRF